MKIHYLQHVPFEDLGMMEPVLAGGGHTLTSTKFYGPHELPSIHNLDWLIVMGGPMGVNDEAVYPWLTHEKKLIEAAVRHHKPVLGICLGAQLIAQVLGSRVHRNQHREIGWFDIETTRDIRTTLLSGVFPRRTRVFHWHGDTFDIPKGAVHIAKSEACANQGFIFENRVIGFQFHLESTLQTVQNLIINCGDELDGSAYVQSETKMLAEADFPGINNLMHRVLDVMTRQHAG
ncbi:MAG: type 1 glutamine amidotransferase [Desulfobacula sp.]|nr:type 1 glutamine amidotransferase [Desulfobacula sp.]